MVPAKTSRKKKQTCDKDQEGKTVDVVQVQKFNAQVKVQELA